MSEKTVLVIDDSTTIRRLCDKELSSAGYEVACELLMEADTATIPVVASSTLRKKAYVEYVDCDNVVDMLPKPYTPEALIATVENAIDTGVMGVKSQADGSAVPEVMDAVGESELVGTLGCFGLREIVDLLNHGSRKGRLTVENDVCRVNFFVERGRIQAVTASGLDPEYVAEKMPESLAELKERSVLKMESVLQVCLRNCRWNRACFRFWLRAL